MARLRTIPKAVKEIKDKDPNSYISAPLLRKWVKKGLVSPIPDRGTYMLIDLDRLENFIAGGAYDS